MGTHIKLSGVVTSVTTFAFQMLLCSCFFGCNRSNPQQVQGYVEGEFVYVASPLAGALQVLSVQRGDQVKAGDQLFALDDTPEKAAHDQAQRMLAQARANLDDAKKGKRPSEIESLQAQLARAKAAFDMSELNLSRLEKLAPSGAASKDDLDRARSQRDQDEHTVGALQADLTTAQLGARPDQIAAADAEVRAREAQLAKAKWDLEQKRQLAPAAGIVFDTMYRVGEWVAAGRPVVALLPPANVKVRAFVPETRIGSIHPGDKVSITIDGTSSSVNGTVSYVSPQAEFTPPVIYSRDTRSKLVFMIEATLDPAVAVELHPGQPVDVDFASH
jgi:HlyD family secretion protein